MRAQGVARERVAAAAGDLGDGEPPQGAARVRAAAEAVEALVRQAVAAARHDDVETVEVERLAETDGLAGRRRRVHGQGHARRLEEGPHVAVPLALGAAGPGVRVDEDVGALAAWGGPVGSGEELGGPFGDDIGAVAGGGGGEDEPGGADVGGGHGLGVVDDEGLLVFGELGPEDVVERYGSRLRGTGEA